MDTVLTQAPFFLSNISQSASMATVIETLRSQLTAELFFLAMVMLWKACGLRNLEIHCLIDALLGDILIWSGNYLATFQQSEGRSSIPTRVEHEDHWKPPPLGGIKINVDAAFPLRLLFFELICSQGTVMAVAFGSKSRSWQVVLLRLMVK